MAARALTIYRAAKSRTAALLDIQAEFDISEPTARNLVNYGGYLERQEDEAKQSRQRLRIFGHPQASTP
jgi:hypothetical protein